MSLTSGEGTPFVMNVEPAGCSNNNGNSGNGWFGGDGAWIIILFFIFAFGWGGFGNGWGGNGGGGMNGAAAQGALTREQACIDNNFNNLMRETYSIGDSIKGLNATICQQQYDTAGMLNALGSTVQGGFNATNVAMLQGFNAIQAQAADCCCKTQSGIEGIKYTIASEDCATRSAIQTGIRDVIDNQNANARAVLDKLTAQELEAKNAQITALNQQLFSAQLAASQGAQTAQIEARADARLTQVLNAINPPAVPAYPAPSPCGLGNWAPQVLANSYANGCGCGCNTGCGCSGYGLAA